MYLDLSPGFRERIVGLLLGGRCAELEKLVRRAGEALQSISEFFSVLGRPEMVLNIEPQQVPAAMRCFGGSPTVRVEVYVPLRWGDLCEEVEEESRELGVDMAEDEYSMVIAGLGPEQLVEILEKLRSARTLHWVPVSYRGEPLKPDEVAKLFGAVDEGFRAVVEEPPRSCRVRVVYERSAEMGGLVLRVVSRILDTTTGLDGVAELLKKVSEEVAEPTVELVLVPEC